MSSGSILSMLLSTLICAFDTTSQPYFFFKYDAILSNGKYSFSVSIISRGTFRSFARAVHSFNLVSQPIDTRISSAESSSAGFGSAGCSSTLGRVTVVILLKTSSKSRPEIGIN